ncbi:hypothetical protein JCM6882_001740 [Rhodosporidiobolus microsporus]
MRLSSVLVALSSLAASSVAAHKEPSTPQEVAEHVARQETIYHCLPKIREQVAARKAARRGLGAVPNVAEQQLYLGDAFSSGDETMPTELSCVKDQETARMRNHTCVLTPVVTQGPYYHDRGHPIRQNMAEDQLGLPFAIDVGVIDVNTCEPLEGVLVDIWHANATGHYAGHPHQEEALKWEGPAHEGPRKGLLSKYPRTKPDETFLRAAWPTNKEGISQFTSIFPGYYTGRATHVHCKVFTEWEPHVNGTYTGGNLIHTGQFFVDDSINQQVDKMWPYVNNPIANKWGRTRNWDDSLSIYQTSHQNGFGPTLDIEFVGGVIQQGLVSFITIGVNSSASYPPTQAWSPITN